jgi:hypothetical protein
MKVKKKPLCFRKNLKWIEIEIGSILNYKLETQVNFWPLMMT